MDEEAETQLPADLPTSIDDERRPLAHLIYQNDQSQEEDPIDVLPSEEIRVGRDQSKCNTVIDHGLVSKQHFRIYTIIYDSEKKHVFQPLIYCEDLQTTNGTFVNGHCIGIVGQEKVGYLLTHGDVIEIRPYWRFRFYQPDYLTVPRSQARLGDLQQFDDRYNVSDRVLGKGQYGAVFLADEIATSKQVACKIVNLDLAAKEIAKNIQGESNGHNWADSVLRVREGRKLVMREIDILSRLTHPHIIDLRKAFCADNSLYIFTELAPGGDLFSYIEAHHGHLSDWHSRAISRQIVLALEYLHSNRVAHRDIKPENVLIMQTDFGGRVVLTDFGFATHFHAKSGRMMSRLGTEGFIAPEVETVDSSRGYTTSADMWSLGVLTACMLTGNSVIPRDEMSQLSQQEIADRFLGLDAHTRHKWQDLTPRALRFLRRLLSINPEQRMTATQALEHSWFKKPLTEATLLETKYWQVIQFWAPRNYHDQVIEHLPTRIKLVPAEQPVKAGPKFRHNIPDTSNSPYFSLDRHLRETVPSQKMMILEKANQSKSLFVEADEPSEKKKRRLHLLQHSMNIEDVPATNMFGKSSYGLCEEETQDEEVEMIDLTADSISSGDINTKRRRVESEDPVTRRIHDEVAKSLPRFTNAKILRDAFVKRKEEIGK